jgi:hypothetical protein
MPPIMPINLMEDALQAEENLTTTKYTAAHKNFLN